MIISLLFIESEDGSVKGYAMNKISKAITICMLLGTMLGMAVGCVLGIYQGEIGKLMCYGMVFGMILGVGIGAAIEKIRSKE